VGGGGETGAETNQVDGDIKKGSIKMPESKEPTKKKKKEGKNPQEGVGRWFIGQKDGMNKKALMKNSQNGGGSRIARPGKRDRRKRE